MAVTQYYGTGRRKTSTARVYLTPGKGTITINDRTIENFFGREVARMIVRQPLELLALILRQRGDALHLRLDGAQLLDDGFGGQSGGIRDGVGHDKPP
jgi:small subunit ribosomal protein S9